MKRVGGGVVIFLALLLCAFIGLQYQEASKLTSASTKIPHKIEKENLLGASPTKVTASLDRDRIDHSSYSRQDRNIVANLYLAASTFSLQTGPLTWDVEVVLRFDKQEHLVGYTVNKIPHGF